jgi:hypothetical protein
MTIFIILLLVWGETRIANKQLMIDKSDAVTLTENEK